MDQIENSLRYDMEGEELVVGDCVRIESIPENRKGCNVYIEKEDEWERTGHTYDKYVGQRAIVVKKIGMDWVNIMSIKTIPDKKGLPEAILPLSGDCLKKILRREVKRICPIRMGK